MPVAPSRASIQSKTPLAFALLAALLNLHCGPDGHAGQSGTEGSLRACTERTKERSVSADELVGDASANELAIAVASSTTTTLTYLLSPGAPTDDPQRRMSALQVTVTPDVGSARAVSFRDVHVPNLVCKDSLELDASVVFQTADGAFAEEFSGVLRTGGTTETYFESSLPSNALRGTFRSDRYPAAIRSEPYQLYLRWGQQTPLAALSFLSAQLTQGEAGLAFAP